MLSPVSCLVIRQCGGARATCATLPKLSQDEGRVHPGQATSSLQGHTETNKDKQLFALANGQFGVSNLHHRDVFGLRDEAGGPGEIQVQIQSYCHSSPKRKQPGHILTGFSNWIICLQNKMLQQKPAMRERERETEREKGRQSERGRDALIYLIQILIICTREGISIHTPMFYTLLLSNFFYTPVQTPYRDPYTTTLSWL